MSDDNTPRNLTIFRTAFEASEEATLMHMTALKEAVTQCDTLELADLLRKIGDPLQDPRFPRWLVRTILIEAAARLEAE